MVGGRKEMKVLEVANPCATAHMMYRITPRLQQSTALL